MLKEIFKELDNTISAEDLDTMIDEIDSDGSGTVDFEGKYSLGDKADISINNQIIIILTRSKI